MPLVAPSILSADFARLGEEITDVIEKGADWIHIDVMDGRFVPNLTIGPVVVEAVKRVSGQTPLDVHLMIVEPDRYVAAFCEAGADIVTVHAEAVPHLHRSIQNIHAAGAKAGVALNPHTHENMLEYLWEDLDLVLAMTVNPGFGGQSMVEAVLRKVEKMRETIVRLGLDVRIEVDGGVKPGNAHRFTGAGADVLVSGSGVFKASDRRSAIAALKAS